mgnify:CR=1 FL=1
MTRRSRNAEHGLERRGKPLVLPIIALLIALGGSFADRQEPVNDQMYSDRTAQASNGLWWSRRENVVLDHPAPEREGEIAARESLEPEGPLTHAKLRDAQNGLTGRRDVHPSDATFHGLTAKGDYYGCVRPAEIRPQHRAYKPLLEFCMRQTQERR